KKLYEKARKFLPQLGINIRFYLGDGSKGLPQQAPFDKILVTAGAPVIPQSLGIQLRVGGIMVIPVGDRSSQKMTRITKRSEKDFETESFENFSFVPLLGDEGWR